MKEVARVQDRYDEFLIQPGINYERIDGLVYMMSAPSWEHQQQVGHIFAELKDYFRSHSCSPFIAPVAVTFSLERGVETEVQPDLGVLCDQSKIQEGKIVGAPELVIEVVSPSTRKKDYFTKKESYREYGVQEYWVIDGKKSTRFYGQFWEKGIEKFDHVESDLFPGLRIDLI